jgi:3-isopropylmalate/(R)-2-methylmalate dehydratase small subunit
VIGGRNFGTGSSRPAARSLRNLGIACLLAESTNGLFFRNAVNFGFLAFDCPGVSTAFEEGDTAEVSVETLTARNLRTNAVLKMNPIPPQLLALMQSGGVFPYLEDRGLIGPAPAAPPKSARGTS